MYKYVHMYDVRFPPIGLYNVIGQKASHVRRLQLNICMYDVCTIYIVLCTRTTYIVHRTR